MLGKCIYDIWERFCVARINIAMFTSKNSSTKYSFFGYSHVNIFLAGDKSRTGIPSRNFNLKSRRALSMQKCKEQVVPAKWNEPER